jgi:hypothetical protein
MLVAIGTAIKKMTEKISVDTTFSSELLRPEHGVEQVRSDRETQNEQ